jgi:hypothetical protein
MDGTTALKWPFFALNFALTYDPLLYDLDFISFAELTALEVVLVGIIKETCLSVKEVAGLLGKQLLTVIAPIHYGMPFRYILTSLILLLIF